MFGGGTSIEVELDASQVPVGGMLSGRATVRGGKKDLKLTALSVRLAYVSVQSNDDSPIPDMEIKFLVDEKIVEGEALPAGSEQTHEFSFAIPTGTKPSAHNVSYEVIVAADIPKVKDPTAKAKLKVVEGGGGSDVRSMNELFLRWPALRDGGDDETMVETLEDFRNECYGEREALIGAEPILSKLVRESEGEVRRAAIEAWGNLLDEQVRKEHLRLLDDLAAEHLDTETTRAVIEAAAKFADEGALPLVRQYAGHADPTIRKELADQLRFSAEDQFKGKLDLLLQLAEDADDDVRAAAFGAFSDYREDKKVMNLCVRAVDSDSSVEVQKACIGTLCFGHYHGMTDMTFETYERHLGNQHVEVREEIAKNVMWLPDDQVPRIRGIVQRLLGDADPEVRRTMAWQYRNLSDFPSLADLLQNAIANDGDPQVRNDGIGSLSTVLPMAQAVAFYRQILPNADEDAAWAVVDGLRWKDEPEAKSLLEELTRSPFDRVAEAARDGLD
jgi:HEAT repeat protein